MLRLVGLGVLVLAGPVRLDTRRINSYKGEEVIV
jgi:hypothetical protein